jgi:hypothetical protein
MDIHYKIVEVNPNEHSIVVRYFTDTLTEEKLSVDPENKHTLEDGSPLRCRTDYFLNLPVPAPTGEALQRFIMERAPVMWFDIHDKINDPNVDTSLSELSSLIGVKNTINVNVSFDPPVVNTDAATSGEDPNRQMTDDDILELLAKAKQGTAA